jgi:uncharacterized membrane protein YdbT with pleckstrin-like domain
MNSAMTGDQDAPERVVALLRSHARVLVLPVLVLLAVAGGAVYGATVLDEEWLRTAVAAAGALVILLLVLVPYVRWLSSHVLITTRRIVVRRGLVVRTRQEILHSRSNDIVLRQSIGQRLFRSGDIHIDTGQERHVVLRDLPRAALVHEALTDLAEHARTTVADVRADSATGGITL